MVETLIWLHVTVLLGVNEVLRFAERLDPEGVGWWGRATARARVALLDHISAAIAYAVPDLAPMLNRLREEFRRQHAERSRTQTVHYRRTIVGGNRGAEVFEGRAEDGTAYVGVRGRRKDHGFLMVAVEDDEIEAWKAGRKELREVIEASEPERRYTSEAPPAAGNTVMFRRFRGTLDERNYLPAHEKDGDAEDPTGPP